MLLTVIVLTILLGLLLLLERRTMWLGTIFLAWLLVTNIFLILTIESYEQHIALIVAYITLGPIIILFPFYFLSFIILLLTSGVQLIKREGRRFRNLSSLTLGLFCIVWAVGSPFFKVSDPTNLVGKGLYLVVTFGVYYFFLVLLIFVISSLFNRIPQPFKRYDYIIVLGSGLIRGKVPPLLAGRIEKGIALFQRFHTSDNPVKVIFTGGQGNDEKLAEGEAMAKYARENGLAEEHIIIENQALNTYENVLFSKRLIEADRVNISNNKKYHTITVTNNFHVFRALLWARKVKLKSDGAGAKTKFYFWLNALIREFIGVLYMQRK